MERGHPCPQAQMSETVDHWHEIRFAVEPKSAEAIEFALNSLGALGTSIDLMPPNDYGVRVVGYFTEIPDHQSIQDELHYALRSYGLDENDILSVERSEVENTDWLAEWKKYWKPTTVGNFVIAAPWHEVDEPTKIVIRIEPNMAFGTGTHETTQLCLKAIDELYTPGDPFLDVGTGTGILAIAAALTGRNPSERGPRRSISGRGAGSEGVKLHGYDTDPDAIEIAVKNANLNGVGNKIEFHVRPIDESISKFDLVCANLTLDVIIPILPLLLQKAKKNLVLSGILKTQEQTIRDELRRLGLNDFSVETAGEWIAAVVSDPRTA